MCFAQGHNDAVTLMRLELAAPRSSSAPPPPPPKKNKCKSMGFLALKLSYVVFLMLINVKMPTIIGHYNIYEQARFMFVESSMKKFIISRPV